MRDPGAEFGLEVANLVRAVERLVVAEKGDDGVGLQMREPLVGRGIESAAEMRIQIGMKFLRAGEGPLRNAARMRTESRGITGPPHVAHDEVQFRIAQVQFGLEAAEVHVALGQAVADEDDALAGGGFGHGLRAGRGRGGGQGGGGVGALVGVGAMEVRGGQHGRGEQSQGGFHFGKEAMVIFRKTVGSCQSRKSGFRCRENRFSVTLRATNASCVCRACK